jgi:hypothetical protein
MQLRSEAPPYRTRSIPLEVLDADMLQKLWQHVHQGMGSAEQPQRSVYLRALNELDYEIAARTHEARARQPNPAVRLTSSISKDEAATAIAQAEAATALERELESRRASGAGGTSGQNAALLKTLRSGPIPSKSLEGRFESDTTSIFHNMHKFGFNYCDVRSLRGGVRHRASGGVKYGPNYF